MPPVILSTELTCDCGARFARSQQRAELFLAHPREMGPSQDAAFSERRRSDSFPAEEFVNGFVE